MQKGGGPHWRRPSCLWTVTPSCGRRGILSKPAMVTGSRRSLREGRHKPRSPCSAAAREGVLRACPTLRWPAAPPPSSRRPAGPERWRAGPRPAATGFSLSDSPESRRPASTGTLAGARSASPWARQSGLSGVPASARSPAPAPRAPYRGVGAAASPGLPPRLPDQQQEGAAVRAGAVAPQHAPGGVAAPPGRATARLAVAAAPRLCRISEPRVGWDRPRRRGRAGVTTPPGGRGTIQKLDLPPSAGTEGGRRNKNKVPWQGPSRAAASVCSQRWRRPRGRCRTGRREVTAPRGGHTSWKVLWKDPYPHPQPPPHRPTPPTPAANA